MIRFLLATLLFALSAPIWAAWVVPALAAPAVAVPTPAPAAAVAPPAKFKPQTQAVPGYRYQALDGTVLSLDPYLAQKVLIVNFWATWCPPCVKELPSLDRLAAALPHDRFQVIAVAQQAEKAEVAGYFKRAGLKTLQPLIDPNLGASRAWGLRGLPTTVIIDGNGQVLGRVEGELEWDAPAVVGWLKGL